MVHIGIHLKTNFNSRISTITFISAMHYPWKLSYPTYRIYWILSDISRHIFKKLWQNPLWTPYTGDDQYIITQDTFEVTEIQILKALIKYAYVKCYGDRRDIFNAYDTYQFPDVEKLIKIILINQPEGNLRWRFNQVFPEEAAKIFGRQTCIFPAFFLQKECQQTS